MKKLLLTLPLCLFFMPGPANATVDWTDITNVPFYANHLLNTDEIEDGVGHHIPTDTIYNLIADPNMIFIPTLKARLDTKPNIFNNFTPISQPRMVIKSATVSSGNAVFHLTSDGTSSGNALCDVTYLDSLMLRADNEADTPFSFGQPVLSNSDGVEYRTITVPVKKAANITTLPILGTLTGALLGAPVPANGSVIKATVMCEHYID